MVFGFSKGKGRASDDDDDDGDEEDQDFVLFQGARNGNNPDLSEHEKLVRAGLVPAKKLVTEALARRAEMIRVEPKGKVASVTFYVDGVAYPPTRMPGPTTLAITQMLKLLAGLDVKERAKPQAGGIKAVYDEKKYEVRIDTAPIEGGAERLLIRTRNSAIRMETPDDLGFSEQIKEKIRVLTKDKKGIVLAAGGPQSGLTSVAVGLVRGVDAYLFNVYSVADHEGRELSHITTEKRDDDEDLDAVLTKIRRAEADVVYVPPVKDKQLATTYLEHSARLCLIAEIAARDAADGVLKFVQLSGNPDGVCESLKLVVSQRLIRLLCQKCRQAYRPNPKVLAKVGLPPETKVLYRAPRQESEEDEENDCSQCGGTGYFGRIGIFEYVEMTDAIRQLVKGKAEAAAIRAQARKERMQTFQADAVRLVAEGKTGLEELQRAFAT